MTVNAYLVWDKETKRAAAFDSGGDAQPLVDEIKKRGLKLQDVYLTHTHIDHVTEVDRLIEKAGGSVGVHVPEGEKFDGAAPFKPGVTFSLGRLQIESREHLGPFACGHDLSHPRPRRAALHRGRRAFCRLGRRHQGGLSRLAQIDPRQHSFRPG